MSPLNTAVIVVLGLSVIVSVWRVVRDSQGWRWTRVMGHFFMAGLLYLLLFPPVVEQRRVNGVVLTPGVTSAQLTNRDQTAPTIALPGVSNEDSTIEVVPDLASGLRQHPEIGDIEILGDGLPARDRDAVGDRGIKFLPGDNLPGIDSLTLPGDVRAGSIWSVRGRLGGMIGAQIQLLDRSGATVATATPDDNGRFIVSARAKTAGQSLYRLRVVDATRGTLDDIAVPLVVAPGDSLRTLILAGAPDPELKYLRRWIVDSGNSVASRIGLSRGIEQLQNAVDLGAASLGKTDLLIADDRAWSSLSVSEKAQIKISVEQGMGLVLRVAGPLSSRIRSEWTEFGFKIESSNDSRSVTLARPVADIPVTRQPFSINAEDSVALAVAEDGSTLSAWRAVGQGRVAIWLPLDTYRLQLTGDESRYGSLWSEVLDVLARARGAHSPSLPTFNRVGQRSEVCDLDPAAAIEDAEGRKHDLLISKDSTRCAAWWPIQSGWHAVVEGASRWPLYVYSPDDAKTLMRAELREATARLVRERSAPSSYRASIQRWPLFLLWLLVSAIFWWLERKLSR
ncbi:MAG: hypothetical protein ABI866_13705 [Dokdonella sp.]